MNIDKLPAGKEMDHAVAEYVMKWERYETDPPHTAWAYLKGGVRWIRPEFSPSTNIAHAIEVAEFLKLTIGPRRDAAPGWYAECSFCREINGHADTPALAICRAALKALSASR